MNDRANHNLAGFDAIDGGMVVASLTQLFSHSLKII